MFNQSLRIRFIVPALIGVMCGGVGAAFAIEVAPGAGSVPLQTQLPLTTGEIPKDGDGSATQLPPAGLVDATDPVPYLSPIARLPQGEIDALIGSPEESLRPFSAGWNLRSRVMLLASSDLRAVRALVEFARTAPSGVVSDIGSGLENAARDAVAAGSTAYGERIQEIIATADVPALNEAYAVAERRGAMSPATAALGAGGGRGGGFTSGSVTGGNDGADGGTGPFGGDRTVPTTMGSYPIYGNSGSFDDTSFDDVAGGFFLTAAQSVPVSPAD